MKTILSKTILYFLFINICIPSLHAQNSSLTHNGYRELELGKNFWSVKHLLGNRLPDDPEKTASQTMEYKVKSAERKYFEIVGMEVHSIEVKFGKDKKIKDILILLEKNKKNIATIKEVLKNDFGIYSSFNTSENDLLFRYVINTNDNGSKFIIYTFDETGEFPVNGFLCIRFHIEEKLADADF